MSMSKLDTGMLKDTIALEYIRFNIPSDKIVASTVLKKRFTELVNNRLPSGLVRLVPDECGKLLISMRKAGDLPRIRDGHGPSKGRKQGQEGG